ncbi:hypothetical protein SAMN04488070_1532 [Pseudidiomarina maritima]|uniref:Trypsin-like peptidase n=1 Tax=Pseudidiomarina maritima TaxID=519453 RepID=A0A1I6H6Z9_9GAMM|nr:hypothetical protein [Pseudidiomarina maritima]SFR50101.1 hypothetical protein SAMN04488070_1532 [Pseudidiomarina maritima]
MKTTKTIASLSFISLLSLFSPNSYSSDVLVSADFNVGQGFNYLVNGTCYVVTPKHVLGDAQTANIMLPTRQYFTADLAHVFDVDMAVLESNIPEAQCNRNTFLQVSDLKKLLDVYQTGVLKTRLADGSVLQSKIVINTVDETEYLAIKPERADEPFKQGYSGSILFVADQAAGVLLEVDDEGGVVYRADALTQMLDEHFGVEDTAEVSVATGEAKVADDSEVTTNSHLTGRLAQNQIKDHEVKMLENSPIEFVLKANEGNRMRYSIRIMDRRENMLLDYDFYNDDPYNFAFTPPKSDVYIVRLVGLSSFGEFDIKMNDFAFDSELRGQGNTITIPTTIEPKVAKDSVAEYRFKGESNSPIEFNLKKVPGQRFRFKIVVVNSEGEVHQDYDFYSDDNYSYAFTPPSNDTYTIKIVGLSSYGTANIQIDQWVTDAVLKSPQNVVTAGEVIEGKLATNAVAEYRMMMTANAPIDFKFERQSKRMRFRLEIFDETNERRYSGEFYSDDEYRIVFTPLSSDVHIIRLTGISSHGNYTIKLFDYD